MLEAELPSFLVPFLAYLYYNLASHEVFPEEKHVLSMPKETVFHFDPIWIYRPADVSGPLKLGDQSSPANLLLSPPLVLRPSLLYLSPHLFPASPATAALLFGFN